MRILAIVHQRDAPPGVFAEAIGRRGAELDVWPHAEREEPPGDPLGYDAVLTFGGAMDVDQEEKHPWLPAEKALLRDLLARERLLMGVCLGAQLLSEAAGGSPRRAREPEIGWFEVELTDAGRRDPLIAPLAPGFTAFEWHSYEAGPPEEAVPLARSPVCAQAYRLGERAWGIQFHAEVDAPTAEKWIGDWREDPDAVRLGLDPERLREETARRLPDWNRLGRDLCARFLDHAAART